MDDLWVPFSAVESLPLPPDPEAAVAYGWALNAIHAAGTVIPFRYGSAAPDALLCSPRSCGRGRTGSGPPSGGSTGSPK
ncbi:hypothetical protein [Frigoriglobus tundricola]|uniref:Uncharacterized protein n=1 Tax=Frigoriglobus tundricola TaxID=2774151 RepID=A0A6M5Z7R0_9BACT|nr:hypothetical protein [Frigoriglobus tundricola]QJX01273.1 hypothetical protein FTUN_8915 [Frigoriglobus tundricola]